jgi:two-component system, sensor histidine kinase FlrB
MKSPPITTETPAQNLAGAFELFLEASQAIEAQHAALTHQIEELREDLNRTSASLRLVLNALPAAVIVVEGDLVGHFNTAAMQLLPELKAGQFWRLPASWAPGGGPGEFLINAPGSPRTVQVQINQQDQRSVIQVQDITENLRSKEAQERVDRLASMGQMSASIAHQLRTPLATALLYSSHLCSPSLASGKKTEFAEHLKQQLLNLEKLSSNMLKFLQTRPVEARPVGLHALLAEVMQNLEALCTDQNIGLSLQSPDDCLLHVDQAAVVSALVGVIENGVQVSSPGQPVSLQALVRHDQGQVEIVIEDHGPGIAADMLQNLFEPFATNRINGTGLGLAIARNTIRNHGGEIIAQNRQPNGARFMITLPMTQADS